MPKPVVFVIGATGQVGQVTLRNLSAKYADRVRIRAGVRNFEKAERIKSLAGVTLIQATMGDYELVPVLSGADVLLIVTPSTKDQAALVVSTAKSARQAGVKHVAVVSVLIADIADTNIGHQFKEIESSVSKLGVPYTFIRLPFFTENYWAFRDTIVKQGVIYCPVDPDRFFTQVALDDVGRVVAKILVNPATYTNKTLDLVSECLTFNKVAREFSAVLGKEVKYVQVPYEGAKEPLLSIGLPEWQAEEVLELYRLIDSSNPVMSRSDVGIVNEITGENPINLKQWLDMYAKGFL